MSTDLYEKLAAEYGLTAVEIREIGDAIATGHALVTHEDFVTGLAGVVSGYVTILSEVPGTFPAEYQETAKIVVDRAVDLLVARLQQGQQVAS